MMKDGYRFGFLILGIAFALVGCSPGKQDSEVVSLNVALVAAHVSDESVEEFATYLTTGLPEFKREGRRFSVVGVSAGNSEADPMSVMAGSTRIATMLASGEIELWICDPENARRYADNGANYVPLDQLFSADEIASFNGTPIAIPVTDDEGNSTGEFSDIVGLDLSENTIITELTGIGDPQMFVLVGSTNPEATKVAFQFLAQ